MSAGPWPVSVAVKSGVANDPIEYRAGEKLIAIGNAHGDAVTVIGSGGRLRNERVDVRELDSQGEDIDVDVEQMPRRPDHLNLRERGCAARDCFVQRPGARPRIGTFGIRR